MLETIVEIILASLVLVGIIKEEKLIEFEDKVLDAVAKSIARVIVARRRKAIAEEKSKRAVR